MNEVNWYVVFKDTMEQLKVATVLKILADMESLDGKESEPFASDRLDEIAIDIDQLTLSSQELDGVMKWFAPKDGEALRFVKNKLRRKWRLHENRINRAIPEGFGNYLKSLRKERGYSLKDLERLTAISPSYINRMEKGERKAPTYPIIVRLAKALGVETSGFLKAAGLDEQFRESIPDFKQLVFGNDFILGGKLVTTQSKEVLTELISAIVEAKWDAKNRNKEMANFMDLVDEFKELLA